MQSVVCGVGGYLPEKILHNQELALSLDTSDDWITERTGIKKRHIACEFELSSDLGFKAGLSALENAGFESKDVELIILATTTPDNPFPATATMIQNKLGAVNAFAFDIQAVCSGFIYALNTADNFIRSGQVKNALVIGAEVMSRILDWQDRSTCVLFGDGSGAVFLQAQDTQDRGILSSHLFSDGQFYKYLYVDKQNANPSQVGHLKMQGREIYKHAVQKIGQAVEVALAKNNLKVEDIDWFVPHQANIRILKSVCDHFSIPYEKMIITVDKHANTSAASIPLALFEAVKDGKIKKNDLVLCEAMGGGLTWGSSIIRW
jgi:3-oxoacyl-[acyl-carrier-protein] synthase-3